MNELTLEELYQSLKQMRKVKENRNKKVGIWFWTEERQIGSCCFDKVGVIVDAGNYWETRAQDSTMPIIKVEERRTIHP